MIPSRRLLLITGVLLLPAFLLHYFPLLSLPLSVVVGALVLVSMVDMWGLRKAPAIRIERQMQGVWPVELWNTVSLSLHNESSQTLTCDVMDAYPNHWKCAGQPHHTTIEAGRYKRIDYQLCPDQRGDAAFAQTFVRLRSRFGLWERSFRLGPEHHVKVFPDFSKLLGNTLTATDRRSPTAGNLRKRRRGEGTDFRQLRDYRQGDSQRSIDWKATARYQKPITREYQEERDQQVIFLLDTGRRMLSKDGNTSHFDHALNAILTLSFIAQKQGDAVGLMTFGKEQRWLAPHKGRIGLDRILAGIYDLQADETAPDFSFAASALMRRLNKRAFIVLITNLRDEDDEAMRSACELLSTKHLVMCASLREKSLDSALQLPVQQFNDALRHSAALQYLQQRDYAIKRLGIRAGQLIDIIPERLSGALVNRYLDIKESGAL